MHEAQSNNNKNIWRHTPWSQSRIVSLRTHFYWDELDFIVYCMNFNELSLFWTFLFRSLLLSCHKIGDGFCFFFGCLFFLRFFSINWNYHFRTMRFEIFRFFSTEFLSWNDLVFTLLLQFHKIMLIIFFLLKFKVTQFQRGYYQ